MPADPAPAAAPQVTEGGLLGGALRYRQFASGHRSGFEPVLLAASVRARAGAHVLEAGTGAGAALLCLGYRVPGLRATGLEIAPELAALANENFRINGMDGFSCTCGDIEQPRFRAEFDHALANPPWHAASSTQSPDSGRALAHHARDGLLPGWIAGLTLCLKPRGSLTLILPAASHSLAIACMRRHDYGAIRLFPLWPRAGEKAKLLLIGAQLGGRGPDALLAGLVLHDDAGITQAAQAILRDGMPTALAR